MNNIRFYAQAADADISSLFNPATNFNKGANGTIADLLNPGGFDVLNITFIVVGLLFFANFVMAGWDYMLSSGDPKKAAVANSRFTNGLTGLVMAITAYLVVKIITTIFGTGSDI